jgi:hypothetical protein
MRDACRQAGPAGEPDIHLRKVIIGHYSIWMIVHFRKCRLDPGEFSSEIETITPAVSYVGMVIWDFGVCWESAKVRT